MFDEATRSYPNVYGPYSFEEFMVKRNELNVSPDLVSAPEN